MKRVVASLLVLLGVCGIAGIVFAGEEDAEGSKDRPYLSRMPGYYIGEYKDLAFDSVEFKTAASKGQRVEGHRYQISYSVKSDATTASPVQIIRNYTNAVKGAGGQTVYSDPDAHQATLKVSKGGAETWVSVGVFNQGDLYTLDIVERQAMGQDVSMDSAALAQQLKDSGKAAIYGIYFDTGKSSLKPESDPALQGIAKLLQENPRLRLYVVGHTDSQGEIGANLRLSEARANEVMKRLVSAYAVSAGRLKAYGVGPLAPVTSNQTEEGRAKNRRVELVSQ